MIPGAPAELPPPGLPGLNSDWSRLVTTPGLDRVGRTWHVLDNRVPDPRLTLLCVHGNPTWSYLWRSLLAAAPVGVRVIAVDQLDMGYSERTGVTRRLAQRIEDLCLLSDRLDLAGPVVAVGHDWGGPISLGWAQRNLEMVSGLILTNTAVSQPEGSPGPRLIRIVRTRAILETICVRTPLFVGGTLALARPRLDRKVRAAYASPYQRPSRRHAIGTFVDDIPLSSGHPSREILEEVAAGLDELASVPSLILWGTSDPVFSGGHLQDLLERLPHAQIHRFEGGGHLVPEDADIAPVVYRWVDGLGLPGSPALPATVRKPLWDAVDRRAGDQDVALVEMGSTGPSASITFADLADDVGRLAAGLSAFGVNKGDRVGLLIPPGIDLAACVIACWRIGAVVVVADAGLGARGLGRALASARPAYLIGVPKAMRVAAALRWPGKRITTRSTPADRLLGVAGDLASVRELGSGQPIPEPPTEQDLAGIGFTSGATGPAKGVRYRHGQLQAQRDALIDVYSITGEDRLVAAFGPFTLFGPLIGIASVVPDMDATSPATLTAAAFTAAVEAVRATLVFASPAALRNVLKTADEANSRTGLSQIRLLMCAGAPVRSSLLRSMVGLMPGAEAHTPYGMTEVLPVADISLEEIESAGAGGGVCVGAAVAGVEITISALDEMGRPTGPLTTAPGVTGEICIRAAHMRDGYDRLWATEDAASQPPGWHRSGDVGHLDGTKRLWVEGRLGHVITGGDGPITPVGIEQAVSELAGIADVAAVGVGPAGAQVLAVVVVLSEAQRRAGLASHDLAGRVRDKITWADVAAVLTAPALPVDTRHNSKIDRSRVAKWAETILAGHRARPM